MAFEIPMSVFGVLWAGEWVPFNDLILMTEEDMRNALIVVLSKHTNQPVEYFQRFDNNALTGKGATTTFLRIAKNLDGDALKKMSDDDQRNALIVENHRKTDISIPNLQAMSDKELVLTGLKWFGSSRPQPSRPQSGPFEIPLSLNGVLWASGWNLDKLFLMSEEDKRNRLIVFLKEHTDRQRVEYFQGFDNNTLVGKAATVLFLRKTGVPRYVLTFMKDDDQRNDLIAENNRKTDISISKLQAMSDKELVLTGLTWLEGSGMQGRPQGKAIFERDPSRDSVGKDRDWQGGRGNDLVTIDYPSHVLFQSAPNVLQPRDGIISSSRDFQNSQKIMAEWTLESLPESSPEWWSADLWSKKVLSGVPDRIKKGRFGVFSPIFPDRGDGDGFSVTKYLGPVPLDGLDKVNFFNLLVDRLKTIPRYNGPLSGTPDQTKGLTSQTRISTGEGEDIVMPGWLGNGIVTTGAGKDIILSSPQMHAVSLYDADILPASFAPALYSANHYVYYPAAYSTRGTAFNPEGNFYRTGGGDDLIYYDSGVSNAFGDEGDDIFAPSFGSFNWAADTLIQSHSRNNPLGDTIPGQYDQDYRNDDPVLSVGDPNIFAPFIGSRGLLSPLKIFNRARSLDEVPLSETQGERYNETYGYSMNLFARLKNTAIYNLGNTWKFGEIYKKNITPTINAGLKKVENESVVVDEKNVNILGGQNLYGGPGNDIFYGIDPQFYDGFITAGNGEGKRVAFNDDTKAPERLHVQYFKPVEMFGGPGADYFSLGNPGNLNPRKVVNGDYLYRIIGNDDAELGRDSAEFGKNASGDVFDFNLSYQGENWTSGIDGAKKSVDKVKVALKTSLKLASKLPVVGTPIAAFLTISEAYDDLKPSSYVAPDNIYYKDPLRDWKKITKIWDWDPSDAIVLRVDPADPQKSDSSFRWDNISFDLKKVNNLNDADALDIVYDGAGPGTPTKPLIRLEKFNAEPASSGAWYAYDFYLGKDVRITEKHLGFFGQLSSNPSIKGQEVVQPQYTDETGFPVAEGESLFRWRDSKLKKYTEKYAKMREVSDKIILQLDTKQLGYYWDVKFESAIDSGVLPQKPSDLTVDKEKSRLWIRSPQSEPKAAQASRGDGSWSFYTFAQIETDPVAKEAANKANPQWLMAPPKSGNASDSGFTPLQSSDRVSNAPAPFGFSQNRFDVADPFPSPGLSGDLLMA